jgi:hypothetical protein
MPTSTSTSQFNPQATLLQTIIAGAKEQKLTVSGPLADEARKGDAQIFVVLQQSGRDTGHGQGTKPIAIAKGRGKRTRSGWEATVKVQSGGVFFETGLPAIGTALTVQYSIDKDSAIGLETYTWTSQIEIV